MRPHLQRFLINRPSPSPKTPSTSLARKIRVVHIQLLPILSGVQCVSLGEFSSLDPEIFETHLICKEPGPFSDAAEKMGVRCHFVNALERKILPFKDYQAYRQLKNILLDIDADVVHTHSSKTGLLGRLAATHAGVAAVVHTVHGFAFPMTRVFLKRKIFQLSEYIAGKHNDAVICLNRDDERTLLKTLKVNDEKVFRIPNGVCLKSFQNINSQDEKTRLRKQHLETAIPDVAEKPMVVQVGRLWEQKNPELFVRAACKLVARGVDANFVLLGDGPLKESLEKIVRQSGAENHVHFLGWRNDVATILPLADLMVSSSNWEGMPLVLLEANACGVPVVATDIAGSRDCISNGETGMLTAPNDVDGLCAKVNHLLSDPKILQAMTSRCRPHVETFHNVVLRHEMVIKLYAELLERKQQTELASLISESRRQRQVDSPALELAKQR